MSVVHQTALALEALRRAVGLLRHAAFWLPWGLLGLVQFGALATLWWFAHPLVSGVAVPVVRRLAGERALHYPESFVFLPGLYAQVDLVLVPLIGAVMAGAATLMVAAYARSGAPRPAAALGTALRRAPAIVAVNLPFHLAAWGAAFMITALVAERHPLLQRAAFVAILGCSVVLQALFLYATAVLLLEECGPLEALRRLPGTWRDGGWAAFVLGVLLLLPLLPLHLLSGQSATIVERGRPELVGWMTAAQVLVALGMACMLATSAALVYVSTMWRGRERA